MLSVFEMGSHYVANDGLNLRILVPQLLEQLGLQVYTPKPAFRLICA